MRTVNLFEVIGTACLDPVFRTELHKDPEQALAAYDLELTYHGEVDFLAKQIKGKLEFLEAMKPFDVICPKPPCPWGKPPRRPKAATMGA